MRSVGNPLGRGRLMPAVSFAAHRGMSGDTEAGVGLAMQMN